MDLELETLRRRHKTELVETALRIYKLEDSAKEAMLFWVDYLLATSDINHMLDCLKQGKPLPEKREFAHANVVDDEPGQYAGTAVMQQQIEPLRAGMPEKLSIAISNHSSAAWEHTQSTQINACYHWLDGVGNVVQFDGERTPLPTAIAPGESLPLELNVVPPFQPGHYQLQLTLVHEGACWFDEHGFEVTTYPVDVEWCLPVSTSRVMDEFEYLRDILTQERKAA